MCCRRAGNLVHPHVLRFSFVNSGFNNHPIINNQTPMPTVIVSRCKHRTECKCKRTPSTSHKRMESACDTHVGCTRALQKNEIGAAWAPGAVKDTQNMGLVSHECYRLIVAVPLPPNSFPPHVQEVRWRVCFASRVYSLLKAHTTNLTRHSHSVRPPIHPPTSSSTPDLTNTTLGPIFSPNHQPLTPRALTVPNPAVSFMGV